jgi:hypothetical protein
MENTGKIELKRILNCMKDYEYDDSLEQGEFYGYYKFNLTKRLHEDHTIKVTIDFPTGIDTTYTYKKKVNGDFAYDDVKNSSRARTFIHELMKDDSTKTGGQKKKQRKTKKNKEKQRNTKKTKKLHLLNY